MRFRVLLLGNKVGRELWVYSNNKSRDSLNTSNTANSKSFVRPSYVRRARKDPGAGFCMKWGV